MTSASHILISDCLTRSQVAPVDSFHQEKPGLLYQIEMLPVCVLNYYCPWYAWLSVGLWQYGNQNICHQNYWAHRKTPVREGFTKNIKKLWVVGSAGNKANSAPLDLELWLSLAIIFAEYSAKGYPPFAGNNLFFAQACGVQASNWQRH